MTENIIVAIIGAVAAIGVAMVTGFFGLVKKTDKSGTKNKTTVNQTVKGNNNTIVGIKTDRKEK